MTWCRSSRVTCYVVHIAVHQDLQNLHLGVLIGQRQEHVFRFKNPRKMVQNMGRKRDEKLDQIVQCWITLSQIHHKTQNGDFTQLPLP